MSILKHNIINRLYWWLNSFADSTDPQLSDVTNENRDGSLENLATLRQKYNENPFISYLNINSLRGDKFSLNSDILVKIPLDIICIDETKLTADFPDALFKLTVINSLLTEEIVAQNFPVRLGAKL